MFKFPWSWIWKYDVRTVSLNKVIWQGRQFYSMFIITKDLKGKVMFTSSENERKRDFSLKWDSYLFSSEFHFCLVSTSSVKVRVLCQGGGGGSSSLIGQKCKMVDGKQSSDWTIIQDDNSACDWTRIQDGGMEKQSSDWTIIQDGGWNRTGLKKMKFSDWPKFQFKFSLMLDNCFDVLWQSIVMQFITTLKFNCLQLKAYKGYL